MPSTDVILHDVQGFARKSGTDRAGLAWTEFEIDAFATDCECEGDECDFDTCPRLSFECGICGERNGSGWMLLDGGDEVCEKHVTFAA